MPRPYPYFWEVQTFPAKSRIFRMFAWNISECMERNSFLSNICLPPSLSHLGAAPMDCARGAGLELGTARGGDDKSCGSRWRDEDRAMRDGCCVMSGNLFLPERKIEGGKEITDRWLSTLQMFQFNSALSRNVEKIQKLAPCLHHSARFRPVGAAMAGSDRTAPPPHAARRPAAATRIAVPRLTHPTSWSPVHQTASARSVLMMTLITSSPNPQKLPKPSSFFSFLPAFLWASSSASAAFLAPSAVAAAPVPRTPLWRGSGCASRSRASDSLKPVRKHNTLPKPSKNTSLRFREKSRESRVTPDESCFND